MVNENINTSEALLKELKFQVQKLPTVIDEVGLASYWLREIHRSLAKVCDEMEKQVA